MSRKNFVLAFLLLAGLLLAACGAETIEVTRVVEVAGEEVELRRHPLAAN
jgi:hypothetical protein